MEYSVEQQRQTARAGPQQSCSKNPIQQIPDFITSHAVHHHQNLKSARLWAVSNGLQCREETRREDAIKSNTVQYYIKSGAFTGFAVCPSQ
jgi:hypothetical protein